MKLKHRIVEVAYKVLGARGLFLLHMAQHREGVRHWGNQKTVFIHVPKTAGTSINRAFGVKDIGHANYEYLCDRYPEKFGPGKEYFVVYREPISRLISTYRYAKKKKAGGGPSVLYWVRDCDNFDEFIRIIYDNRYHETHYFFWPTSKFIKGLKRVTVLPFENLADSFNEYIGREMGIASLPHFNVSSHNENKPIIVSKEAELLVREMYKEDLLIGAKVMANGVEIDCV